MALGPSRSRSDTRGPQGTLGKSPAHPHPDIHQAHTPSSSGSRASTLCIVRGKTPLVRPSSVLLGPLQAVHTPCMCCYQILVKSLNQSRQNTQRIHVWPYSKACMCCYQILVKCLNQSRQHSKNTRLTIIKSVPVEYVPNPHDEHAVAPALSENVPGSQLSHKYGPPRCPLRSEFMAEKKPIIHMWNIRACYG